MVQHDTLLHVSFDYIIHEILINGKTTYYSYFIIVVSLVSMKDNSG